MRHKKLLTICPVVILSSLLMNSPLFAELPITGLNTLTESGMRQWSESEVDELIDELTEAAHEAIEAAAGEAAKAAALASLQSQAASLAAAAQWERRYNDVKKSNVKNIGIASLSCFVLGAVVSSTTILIIRGR
jgi:hypothetical protein